MQALTPHVYWAQRHGEIYLRVEISDAKVRSDESLLLFLLLSYTAFLRLRFSRTCCVKLLCKCIYISKSWLLCNNYNVDIVLKDVDPLAICPGYNDRACFINYVNPFPQSRRTHV